MENLKGLAIYELPIQLIISINSQRRLNRAAEVPKLQTPPQHAEAMKVFELYWFGCVSQLLLFAVTNKRKRKMKSKIDDDVCVDQSETQRKQLSTQVEVIATGYINETTNHLSTSFQLVYH